MVYQTIDPAELGTPRGFSHGLLAPSGGRVLFVAGQDAATANGDVETDDFVEQFGIALAKTLSVVRSAGGAPDSIGRMTVYVTDLERYRLSRRELGRVYRDQMGRHYPAMALVEVRALVDPRALIEIEATAVLPDGAAAEG